MLLGVCSLGCAQCGFASSFGTNEPHTDAGTLVSTAPDSGVRRDGGERDGGELDAGDAGPAVPPHGVLVVSPATTTLNVTVGQPFPTATFTATVGGVPVTPAWAVSTPGIGHVDINGVFTPDSGLGGPVTVTATFQSQHATGTVIVTIHQVDNGTPPQMATDGGTGVVGAGGNGGVGGNGPGGPVTAAQLQVLSGTPVADPGLAWLYPYDQTVWPQGLLAPLLQWQVGAQGDYDGVFIHVQEANYEYSGYFAKTATPFVNYPMPQAAWASLGATNTGEPVTVSLTFVHNGVAYGPITETWQIALGALGGIVYYQSYGTNLVQNLTSTNVITGQPVTFGGATLSVTPGATGPAVVAGSNTSCRVCHSGSSDGSQLITQQGENYKASSAFALANNNVETPMSPTDGQFLFPAIYPDGSMLFSNSVPAAMSYGSSVASGLYTLPGGTAVPGVSGLPAGLGGSLPSFSPDGTHVAFNFYAGTIGAMAGDGISLAAMDFNLASLAFSNPRVLTTPASGHDFWPSFMPMSDGVVYELEVQSNGRDMAGTRATCDTQADACSSTGTLAEIWWVDLATHMAHRLDNLNGVGYLPTGPNGHTNDEQLNYEPTVNPIIAGGYAWVAFTSRRMYGNVATINGYWSDPRYHDLTNTPVPKKLWVAAIDLNAAPGTDPSHPAFYLPGQELLAGNSRGFWGKPPVPPRQYFPPASW